MKKKDSSQTLKTPRKKNLLLTPELSTGLPNSSDHIIKCPLPKNRIVGEFSLQDQNPSKLQVITPLRLSGTVTPQESTFRPGRSGAETPNYKVSATASTRSGLDNNNNGHQRSISLHEYALSYLKHRNRMADFKIKNPLKIANSNSASPRSRRQSPTNLTRDYG